MNNRYRIKIKGCRAMWVEEMKNKKSGIEIYKKINRGGEWGNDNKIQMWAITSEDIEWKEPAKMNNKYGWLEISN